MDQHNRRKRRAFVGGTCCLISGIICLIIRNSNINSHYYYGDPYSDTLGLLIAGIINISIAALLYLYGLTLHLRPPSPVPQTTCVIISSNQVNGVVGYAPPAQQPLVSATNLPYLSGNFPNQTVGCMPGYPNSYPTGIHQPPDRIISSLDRNVSSPTSSVLPHNGNFPMEPPPPYAV